MEGLQQSVSRVDDMTPKTKWQLNGYGQDILPRKKQKPTVKGNDMMAKTKLSQDQLRAFIIKNPGLSQPELSEKMGWTITKVHYNFLPIQSEFYAKGLVHKSMVLHG